MLCEAWPCVSAGEPPALFCPQEGKAENEEDDAEEASAEPRIFPKLAYAEINTIDCLPYRGPECGACEGSCPVPNALIWKGTQPYIDMIHCVGCGLCRAACIADPSAALLKSLNSEKSI